MRGGTPSHAATRRDLDRLVRGFLSYAIAKSSAIKRYNTAKVIIEQNDLEHMGAVTMTAMLLSDYFNRIGIGNDTEKVMRIAITHDLDEAVSGDVPHEAKYQFGKHSEKLRSALEQLSEDTVKTMYGMIKHQDLRTKYIALYKEQKTRKSIESQVAKLADYIDVIIYCENEMRMGNKDLSASRKSAGDRFNEMLNRLLDEHGGRGA